MSYQSRAQERKSRTLHELQLALARLQRKGLKVSIKAVAQEAGVDPSLIHHTYPDFAEEVRAVLGRTTRQRAAALGDDLKEARARSAGLLKEVASLRADLQKMASVNLTLTLENRRLEEALATAIAERAASAPAPIGRARLKKV